MGGAVARVGSTSSHGGTIISGSSTVIAGGAGVARLGDSHSCPIIHHGVTAINSASSSVKADGIRVARVGDTVGCGATITTGLSSGQVG